uniref:DNA mismatch repair protein MSH3, putative n=1 Tax=Arundo donax TaxID=35708 RepID=A0A0A9GAS8_ARUDO
MAAKLQEELSVPVENRLWRTMDAPTAARPSERAPKIPLLCAQPYQGLAEAYHRILLSVTSTQSNNDVTSILSSLKNAREVAQKTIEGFLI